MGPLPGCALARCHLFCGLFPAELDRFSSHVHGVRFSAARYHMWGCRHSRPGAQSHAFPRACTTQQLCAERNFGLIRHPLYTAVFCGAVGWALVWRSAPALFAALALGPFFAAKARREERTLREKFPEYAQYEQRVRRFIPWFY